MGTNTDRQISIWRHKSGHYRSRMADAKGHGAAIRSGPDGRGPPLWASHWPSGFPPHAGGLAMQGLLFVSGRVAGVPVAQRHEKCSSLRTAVETVGLESCTSSATRTKEPDSTTLQKYPNIKTRQPHAGCSHPRPSHRLYS